MTTKDIGDRGEDQALRFLKTKGLKLIERNYRCKLGEIDLIMQDTETLIFIEVRLRSNPNYGSGADTVTRSKQRKLIKTAQFFLMNFPQLGNLDCRFDVISIDTEIDWIPHAFTLN